MKRNYFGWRKVAMFATLAMALLLLLHPPFARMGDTASAQNGSADRKKPKPKPLLISAPGPAPRKPTPAASSSAPRSSSSPTPHPQQMKNRDGIELVRITPGSFIMGSMNGEANEQPIHSVTISAPFYMGKYEVTQAQWQAVMGTDPSNFKGDSLPVEQVSWDDAQEFIRKLNVRNNGFLYRLPTEAEWEYAARARTTGNYAGSPDLMAWYGNNSGRQYFDAQEIFARDTNNYEKRIADNGGQTHPVGQKQANGFGLYDMYGNVWEWCQDYYHESYNGAPADGSVWLSGGNPKYRMIRGGSWITGAPHLRAAPRDGKEPTGRFNYLGFRVAAVAR